MINLNIAEKQLALTVTVRQKMSKTDEHVEIGKKSMEIIIIKKLFYNNLKP